MKVKEAKEVAAQWVDEYVAHLPGFHGAYLAGGIHRVADDDPLPPHIDVDVHVILERPHESGQRQEAYLYHGVLIESYYVDRAGYQSWEQVVSDPLESQSFRSPCVLADPTGTLTPIQQAVAEHFTEREWLEARCGALKQQIAGILANEALSASMPHMVRLLALIPYLIANVRLKGPTNRRAYCQLRDILHADNREDLFESIMALNDLRPISREEVEVRLQESLRAFDRAVEVFKTPFFSQHRIHSYTRPYVEAGAREMIEQGYHREAMSWIIWHHVIANVVIQTDAPEEEKRELQETYDRLYGDSPAWYGRRKQWPDRNDTLLVGRVAGNVLSYVDGVLASQT
jgi:hypothetical protein